jgi:hypothetical protein
MKRRTKMMVLTGVILLAGFMVFMSVGGFAANPQPVTVSASVSAALQMSMSDANTVDWGGVALAPGSVYTDSITATVSSNKVWSLVVTKSADLTSGAFTIPTANLTYGVVGAGGVKNPAPSGSTFGTGSNVCNTCDRGSGETAIITYSLNLPWTVEGGLTYAATHTYTASQP